MRSLSWNTTKNEASNKNEEMSNDKSLHYKFGNLSIGVEKWDKND